MPSSLDGIRILIAEDEILLRELLVAHLEMRGAQVDCANDGEVAFDLMKSRDYDVVITDIRMPRQDGATLLRRIREKNSNNPPVIMISGFSDYSENDLMAMGAQAVLFKPFGVQEFERMIKGVLKKSSKNFTLVQSR